MSLDNDVAAGSGEATAIAIVPAPAGDAPLGAREAARNLASWRHRRERKAEDPADRARSREGAREARADEQAGALRPSGAPRDPAEQAAFVAGPADAFAMPVTEPGGPQAPPGETESVDPVSAESSADAAVQAQLSPIEPPRSWSKEDKELFAGLPRETQERLADRERLRESDFSRRQREATEQREVLDAEQARMEQARQHYESALPQLLNTLQDEQEGEFADIRTLADLERLSREDHPRFLRWDLHQKKKAFVARQLLGAIERQGIEQRQRFSEFAVRQDQLFVEKVPELTDPGKAAELKAGAVATLRDLGFEDAEIGQAWWGERPLSLRDHRLQLLVRDATLWRQAQQKAKAAASKPVPPVQRPGVAQPKGMAMDVQIQNLTKRLDQSGSLKDAAALLRARRAAR